MDWKDTLLAGGSRVSVPGGAGAGPGGNYIWDNYGAPQWRNDWVMGPNGVPVISGSSEAQPGSGPQAMAGPSGGFMPVDPGVYGTQVFAGRNQQIADLYNELLKLGEYKPIASLAPPTGSEWQAPQDSLDAFRKLFLRKKATGASSPSLTLG